MRACASASSARWKWVPNPCAARSRSSAASRGGKVRGVVRVELDAEERRRVALDEALPQRVKLRTSCRVTEDEAVHDLDRGRLVRQDQRRGRERFEKIVELHREHGLGLRQRHEVQACLEHDAERALGSHEELRQVERLARQERVEVVAADAPQHLREPAFDLVRVLGGQAAAPSGSIATAARSPDDASASSSSVHRPRAERPCRRRAALPARARDRSSCRRTRTARRSSCWPSCRRPWRGSPSTYRVRSAARAASSAAFSSSSTMPGSTRAHRSVGPHLEQAVEVLGRVDDQAAANRLAGLRRAAAAHRERTAKLAQTSTIATRSSFVRGTTTPIGSKLIDAGVGGVERARDRVEPDFAGHARFEGPPERVGIDDRRGGHQSVEADAFTRSGASTRSAAVTPPSRCGTPAARRPISTPASVPASIRSLKLPR